MGHFHIGSRNAARPSHGGSVCCASTRGPLLIAGACVNACDATNMFSAQHVLATGPCVPIDASRLQLHELLIGRLRA